MSLSRVYDELRRYSRAPEHDGPFTLGDVPAAIQLFGDGRHKGKVVISVTTSEGSRKPCLWGVRIGRRSRLEDIAKPTRNDGKILIASPSPTTPRPTSARLPFVKSKSPRVAPAPICKISFLHH